MAVFRRFAPLKCRLRACLTYVMTEDEEALEFLKMVAHYEAETAKMWEAERKINWRQRHAEAQEAALEVATARAKNEEEDMKTRKHDAYKGASGFGALGAVLMIGVSMVLLWACQRVQTEDPAFSEATDSENMTRPGILSQLKHGGVHMLTSIVSINELLVWGTLVQLSDFWKFLHLQISMNPLVSGSIRNNHNPSTTNQTLIEANPAVGQKQTTPSVHESRSDDNHDSHFQSSSSSTPYTRHSESYRNPDNVLEQVNVSGTPAIFTLRRRSARSVRTTATTEAIRSDSGMTPINDDKWLGNADDEEEEDDDDWYGGRYLNAGSMQLSQQSPKQVTENSLQSPPEAPSSGRRVRRRGMPLLSFLLYSLLYQMVILPTLLLFRHAAHSVAGHVRDSFLHSHQLQDGRAQSR
jgi:hypothetical protein